MTVEEKKVLDETRFVIVNMLTKDIVGVEASEGAAKTSAEDLAANNEGVTFCVFQKIGTARLEPRVVWKGVS